MAESDHAVSITTLQRRPLAVLRLHKPAAEMIAAVSTLLNLPLPDTSQVAERGESRVFRVAPGEWMLVGVAATNVERQLAEADADLGLWHCAEMTDAYTVLTLTGQDARDLLAKGCSLDMHPRALAAGHCAGTLLAQIDLLVHKVTEDRYELYCDRSWAGHVVAWLQQTETERQAPAA
ncbi:sarcosine oxidase gamma subunit [Novosphingobium sp. AP12]|nr:sarcosine oxidase gamma subunit [Novosphingobium sp. AP12]